MRLTFFIIFIFFSISLYAQNRSDLTKDSIEISKEDLSNTLNLLTELNTRGVDLVDDSLMVSEEFNKLVKDEKYRSSFYPEIYSWEQTINYINNKELKKAFWFLINLYPVNDKNKSLVVRSIISYDQVFKMDKVLINTFYTYAFTDPEVGIIVNNTPEITRPDILENKLRTVNELIKYIVYYRNQKNK